MTPEKNRYLFLLIGILLLLSVIPKSTVKADVGVPPAHPGYSLSPGDYETNVQMVSEEVRIVINEDPFKALVTASFQMQNNGAEDEEIEVWFPLGERKYYAKKDRVVQVADFQAWVSEEEMDITIETSDEWNLVWAHWTVTFPPKIPIEIRVSYLQSPSWDNSPPWFGRFDYILETGAGWQGVIESAEIIIQTPYPPGELDVLLGFGDPFYAKPNGYSINHSEIRWTFYNLEPTEEDNINFSLLEPETWHSIYNSYKTLETTPDDWEAHESLARALSIWKGSLASAEFNGFTEASIEPVSIAGLAGDSWIKVLELSPPDANRFQYALFFFLWNTETIEPFQLQNYYNEAIDLFPEDEGISNSYARAVVEGVINEGAASISPTPPSPDATDTPVGPMDTETSSGSTNPGSSPPISLIMGIIFIVSAGVLIIIAVKRGEKKK